MHYAHSRYIFILKHPYSFIYSHTLSFMPHRYTLSANTVNEKKMRWGVPHIHILAPWACARTHTAGLYYTHINTDLTGIHFVVALSFFCAHFLNKLLSDHRYRYERSGLKIKTLKVKSAKIAALHLLLSEIYLFEDMRHMGAQTNCRGLEAFHELSLS